MRADSLLVSYTSAKVSAPSKLTQGSPDFTVGKEFLKNEKLGDTRLVTQMKKSKKPQMRKGLTISRTIEEAKLLLANDSHLADTNAGRTLRKRSASATFGELSNKKTAKPKTKTKKSKTDNGPSGDADDTA